MVVRECAKSLAVLALADEVTGRLGHEPDQEELEDGGGGLQEGGNTPCPLALDVLGAERGP